MLKSLLSAFSARLQVTAFRWIIPGTSMSPLFRLIGDLRDLGRRLENIGSSTENEFLTVGGKLQGFYSRAREISKLASSVSVLMAGRAITDSMDGFDSICADVQRLEEESSQGAETLRSILETVGFVRSRLSGFGRMARELRVLCTSTRIESARLGERDLGFGALSDDVRKLACEIEEKCGSLLEQVAGVAGQIESSLVRVFTLDTARRNQAGLILERATAGLFSLKKKHDLSSVCAISASKRLETLSKNIGEIVASMQFHDIARQRIEHVSSALDGLEDQEGQTGMKRGPSGSTEERARSVRAVSDICVLQAAQLRHTREELVGAVARIVENLEHVARNAADIAADTRNVISGAADDEGSYIEEMERDLSSLASTLEAYGEANEELCNSFGAVGATIAEMHAFAGVIEGIGIRIRLIALNAIVKAAQMGSEGASLGVLAEAIHRLSEETCRQTGKVGESLQKIGFSASLLRSKADVWTRGPEGDSRGIAQKIDGISKAFQRLNLETASLLTQVDEQSCSLSREIEETVTGITVHERVSFEIDSVVLELEKAVSSLSSWIAEDGSGYRATDLMRDLNTSYTMQSEREIHVSVLGAGVAPERSLLSESPDVELFGEDPVLFMDESGTDVPENAERAFRRPFSVERSHADGSRSECGERRETEADIPRERIHNDEDLGDNVELF